MSRLSIHHDLDKWAYDIEVKYKNDKYISSKQKKQYLTIIRLRDKYYNLYLKNFKKRYGYGCWIPEPKLCRERFPLDLHLPFKKSKTM